jgi:DNA (cytosine-5)-methyltransferase 1
MPTKPFVIYDLCCGAGGAAMGLHQAFPTAQIIGVDINPQDRYPFEFIQANALSIDLTPADWLWSSPPCQRYSSGAGKWGTQSNHPHLIPQIRERLIATGKPYVIENIAAARQHLISPLMLCGTQFNLGVFRHRLFETSFSVSEPLHTRHLGSIGDGHYHTVTGHAGGSSNRDGWTNGSTADWRIAMGIEWMTGSELAEAIPPAYSYYIAEQWKALA